MGFPAQETPEVTDWDCPLSPPPVALKKWAEIAARGTPQTDMIVGVGDW